ncbi:hypothetical protein COOONC_04566 [Cooperia oncophora]
MSGVTCEVRACKGNLSGLLCQAGRFRHIASQKIHRTATEVELHIPFPKSDEPDPKCPGIEIAPSMWSFSVVVQRNEINAPSLVTSVDRVFNVTCNYAELLERSARRNYISITFLSKILKNIRLSSSSSYVFGEANETKSSRIDLQILRDGQPVTTVPLGDEVELRWRSEL